MAKVKDFIIAPTQQVAVDKNPCAEITLEDTFQPLTFAAIDKASVPAGSIPTISSGAMSSGSFAIYDTPKYSFSWNTSDSKQWSFPTFTYMDDKSITDMQIKNTSFTCAQCDKHPTKMVVHDRYQHNSREYAFWCHGEIFIITLDYKLLESESVYHSLMSFNPLFSNSEVRQAAQGRLNKMFNIFEYGRTLDAAMACVEARELALLAENFGEAKQLIIKMIKAFTSDSVNVSHDVPCAVSLKILETVDREAAINLVQNLGPKLPFTTTMHAVAGELDLFHPKYIKADAPF